MDLWNCEPKPNDKDALMSDMEILEDARVARGWITFRMEDRWCQAKVYDVGSIFGINDGRVSKLCVSKSGVRELGAHTGLNFFDHLDFNYDRGLDFDHLEPGVLERIVGRLEALPKASAN